MAMQKLSVWFTTLYASLLLHASGPAQSKDKKKGEKPFRSSVVALTDKAPGDWLLKEAKVGTKMISDRDYTISALPKEIQGGTLLLRTSADYGKWLPPATLNALKDGSVYALIRWKYLGKEEVGEVAFAKLDREGWMEVDGDVATTFNDGEDWRWKAIKRDFKKGDVILPLKTFNWDKGALLFVFKRDGREEQPLIAAGESLPHGLSSRRRCDSGQAEPR